MRDDEESSHAETGLSAALWAQRGPAAAPGFSATASARQRKPPAPRPRARRPGPRHGAPGAAANRRARSRTGVPSGRWPSPSTAAPGLAPATSAGLTSPSRPSRLRVRAARSPVRAGATRARSPTSAVPRRPRWCRRRAAAEHFHRHFDAGQRDGTGLAVRLARQQRDQRGRLGTHFAPVEFG